jgi:GT2 family glycosyltransferase
MSVVIPSVNGWDDLEGCLAALAAQPDHLHLETIVADRVGESVRVPLRDRYPHVRLLEAGLDITIPDLRALAFERARAEIVGVIEDHVIVPPDWAERMIEAHGAGAEVVGGAVDNAADQRWVDWAAFLCEYSHCLVPPTGPADWVTGNNVTYRRDLLKRFRGVLGEGRWENHLHDALRNAGITLVSCPDIRVGHKKHYTAAEYLHQRYLYARSYAGMRLEGASTLRKLGYGSAALALPPLLLTRIVSRVLQSGRHRRELFRSLPLLALFVTAWAAGEVVGYWRGDGDSLKKVC